jgi:shikimate 5-dehydrogenase
VLVLGAGGAAKAAVGAYEEQGASEVVVASRRDGGWPPSAAGFGVIVNCTPVTDDALVSVEPHQAVVDMAYRPDGSDTALVQAARSAGCRVVVDGLTILLEQGVASFESWTQRSAPREAMRDALLHTP